MHPARPASDAVPGVADLSFQALVESSEDIVTVVEADGRIAYDSPAVERALGYGQGELVGRNAFEFVHADDLAGAFALLVDTASRPAASASLTFRFQHRDGSWRWLASVGRVLATGPGVRLVVTSRDVTGHHPAAGLLADESGEAEGVEAVHVEMLERLARAAEVRDDETGQHTRRVGELSARLGAALGLPAFEVELLRRAAPLHDLGKIGIRDAILLKRGPLSVEELEVMRTHTVLGARLLARGRSALIRAAESIALHHHERWDGSGYPAGLAGGEIPLPARIVAIVDFYDALTHDRPYRRAWPRPAVLQAIGAGAGSHFDPLVADAFLGLPTAEAAAQRGGTIPA